MTAYMDLNGIPATGNRWLFTEVLRGTLGLRGLRGQRRQRRAQPAHPRLRRRPDRRGGPRRQRRGGHGDGRSPTPPTPTCPRRWTPGRRTSRRSTRACGASSRRRSAWACSTTRTSTRTAPARCWPIRPTATWPGSPPSGPRCCCATRASCCRSTPSALGSIAVIGPLADSARDIIGPWVFDFDLDETVTVLDGIRARAGDAIRVEHARGVPVVQREFPSLFDMFGGNTPARSRRVRRGRRVPAGRRPRRAAPMSRSWWRASGRT